ncbi:MAG: hypothetical protein ACE5EL_02005, partial [Anaerolineae bacterium]
MTGAEAAPVQANVLCTGSLSAADPTFNRPFVGGSCFLSAIGTDVHYDAYGFTVGAPSNWQFSLCGGAAFDTVLVLYEAPFDPTQPCTRVFQYDDDFCNP